MLTPADLKPLLRGHYTRPEAMWQAFGRVAAFVTTIVSKRVPRSEREAVVMDVWSTLAGRAERHQGLPCEAPEHKQVAWFARCVWNALVDLKRKEKGRAARDAAHRAEVAHLHVMVDEPAPETSELWAPLEVDECPPNYRLAMKAWYCPARLHRRDVDVLAERSQRGKVDQKSGLVRPAVATWPMLQQVQRDWPDGILRRRPGIDQFAFAVRSEATDFVAWVAEKKAASAERETVGKWHVRGRKWLKKRAKA